MRIYGPNGTSAAAAKPAARRTSSGSFTLESEGASSSQTTKSAGGVRTLGGMETLLALQEFEEPGERRRRAVKRGRSALDALDELKLSLLSGSLDTASLARLKAATNGLSERTGDPGLDGVLAEIELRVEVELAKIGMPDSARKSAA